MINKSIWEFLMLALQKNIVEGVNTRTSEEIEVDERITDENKKVIYISDFISQYEKSSDIYNFEIDDTSYQVCFNEETELKKGQEYFSRGSKFVKDLLNKVFNKYRLLVVNNAEYPNIDVDASGFFDGTPECVAQENVTAEDVISNYRYRVGFSIVIKDQIEKTFKTRIFHESLTMDLADDGKTWNYSPSFIVNNNSDQEVLDAIDLSSDSDNNIKKEIVTAITNISVLLQDDKKKKEIFEKFKSDESGEINEYINQRENVAKDANDIGNVVYKYNVTASTMYIDKVQNKKYTYELRNGVNVAQVPAVFNLRDGLTSIKCPHCGKVITKDGKNKLCLALDKNKKATICCHECSTDLSVETPEIYNSAFLCRYVNDPDCIIEAIYQGKKRLLYIGDTYQNILDGLKRYSEEGSIIPDYIFVSSFEIRPNVKKVHMPDDNNWIYRCPNCDTVYARNNAEATEFSNYISRFTAKDKTSIIGCSECVDKPASDKIKTVIYKSDIGDDVYFVNPDNGIRCNICGNVGYKGEFVVCEVCKRYVCRNCRDPKENKHCQKCQSYFSVENRAGKTECDENESKRVWSYIKSNVPMSEWNAQRQIYKESDAEGATLYFIVFPKNNTVYCFELDNKKYYRIYPN